MRDHQDNSKLPARFPEQCSLTGDELKPRAVTFTALDSSPSPLWTHLVIMSRRKWTLVMPW